MKILVIGQGGREHAIIWKLLQSDRVELIYCAPGNGGIAELAQCVPIAETNQEALADFALEKKVDLTIVGPEIPLFDGLVDYFQARHLRIFGPSKKAAFIEGSKAFAKKIMQKYHIPTADYQAFDQYEEAFSYLQKQRLPMVIKADGLAAGKGVVVATNREQAEQALYAMMKEQVFGEAGNQVVIEEYLQGQELSLMAFVNGEVVKPMVPVQDHKPVFDGDEGPNTGGMGAYSPVPQFSAQAIQQACESILEPMARALKAEGIDYQGVLYAGLMMTNHGPKVIEFNARFGDPETQVVLPRMKNDLLSMIDATLDGTLENVQLQWTEDVAVCVVLASEGYPGPYPKGLPITGLLSLQEQNEQSVYLFHAGTMRQDHQLVTSGGRVLGVVAKGKDLSSAREKAYQQTRLIHFKGMHYRQDIAHKAIRTSFHT